MTTEQEELFRKDPLIKAMIDLDMVSSIKIVGGAVIDILEGRKVKDYDCFGFDKFEAEKLGFEYQYETKTAKTFKKGDIIVQNLKTDINDFDFKISQANITWNYQKSSHLF